MHRAIMLTLLSVATSLSLLRADPPAKAKPVDIPALIDKLAEAKDENVGGLFSLEGGIIAGGANVFLPTDWELEASSRALVYQSIVRSEVAREIVKCGVDAIPHLIHHLDDPRRPNLNTGRHRISVGDLCYVVMGQIVNTEYSLWDSKGLYDLDIRPLMKSSTLRANVANQWEGLAREKHRALLVAQFEKPKYPEERVDASKRLAWYYPETFEDLVVKFLKQAKAVQGADLVKFIDDGLKFDHRAKIDDAICDILVSANDREQLALACIKRLIGRGYDAEIEAQCRRWLASKGARNKQSFREFLCQLGRNRLHIAVIQHIPEYVREYASNPILLNAADRSGNTPLHLAAESGDAEIVKLLLTFKPDLNRRNSKGATPVMLAARNRRFTAAADLLARAGCETPDIFTAAIAGRDARIEELLKADKALIVKKTPDGDTALHLAARQGHISTVKKLLAAGAQVNAADGLGYTPLHAASAGGNAEVIQALVNNRADVRAADEFFGFTPLHVAAGYGNEAVVSALLDAKAPVNAELSQSWDDRGFTPLHLAVIGGNANVVEKILKRGVSVDKPDHADSMAVLLAAEMNQIPAVELLLKNRGNIEAKDWNGRSPLLIAVQNGYTDMVVHLLMRRANPNSKNNDDDTPLSVALEKSRLDLAILLWIFGAKE